MDDNLQTLFGREWVLTNGIGGYALSYGSMMNKRKYNGLLIASCDGFRRVHVLSSIEEKIEGTREPVFLDSNHYPNCVYPDGSRHIVKAWLRPYPAVLYNPYSSEHNYLILKEVFLAQGINAVVVKYSNLGKKPISISLRPKFTLRDHHAVDQSGTWDRVQVDCSAKDAEFSIRRSDSGMQAFGYSNTGQFSCERVVFRNAYYPVEMLRGYTANEDLISPVCLRAELEPESSLVFLVSDCSLDNPVATAKDAEAFYKSFPLPNNHPALSKEKSPIKTGKPLPGDLFSREDYLKILHMAARDFVVDQSDVIAGYPWFGPWGRDSMISLGGVALLEGGRQIAKAVLKKYGTHIRNGLMPNTFGEGGEGLNYDTVDAPLWFVLRCREFAPEDAELFKQSCCVVLNYMKQQDLPFFMADDGLVEIRPGAHALTWMDAKIYGNPVTPRFGKPVEINALWYNALRSVLHMAKLQGASEISCGDHVVPIEKITELSEKVAVSFKKFIGPQYLADRLENDEPVWEIRPNAIIAMGLPFDVVSLDVMESAWKMARSTLLTPYGLRTLDPLHPAYKQKYIGSHKQRDLAYHQGTVWAFLLGSFAKLAAKVLTKDHSREEIEKEISGYIWVLRDALMKGEFASVAEVWDGTDPYFPKGCPAQAWSVFALLEIENMLNK